MKDMLRLSFAASAAVFVTIPVLASATPAAAAATGFYVDCSATANGNGSSATPWNSLAGPNGHTFGPGATLSLRSGTTCTGTLAPLGSGVSNSPVTVTSYGSGALPVINGNGAPAVFTLTNQDHWKVQNLKLTNPADTLARRAGLSIFVTDGAAHRGYDIGNLVIDRVAGQTAKTGSTVEDFVQSAGILTGVRTVTTGTINDVHVHDNTVSNTGGGGIKIRVGHATKGAPNGTGVLIERNRVDSVGGDGIIASFADSPMIQDNIATRVGSGVYPFASGVFAGIWVLGDHNPTIQRNVVTDITRYTNDSQAFDCDWGITGTCTVQYNYSRDNAGGFFMNCDNCGLQGGALQLVRYNISENDCRMTSHGGASALRMYNNVIYCTKKKLSIGLPSTSLLENNIWVGTPDSTLPTGSGKTWLWNVFQGVPRPTNNGIAGDPLFVNPGTGGSTLGSADGYKLRAGSPALLNGGILSSNGGRDFWGNPVSSSSKPNRGAYNGPGL